MRQDVFVVKCVIVSFANTKWGVSACYCSKCECVFVVYIIKSKINKHPFKSFIKKNISYMIRCTTTRKGSIRPLSR